MPPPVHEWLRPFVVLIVAMLGIENLQKDQSVINNSTKTTVNNLSCPYRDTKSSIGGHWQWNTSHLYDFCSAIGNFFFMFSTVQGSNHHSYCNCQIYPKKKKKKFNLKGLEFGRSMCMYQLFLVTVHYVNMYLR